MKNLLSLFIGLAIVTMALTAFAPELIGTSGFALAMGGVVLLSVASPKLSGINLYETIGLDAARGAFTNAVVTVYREKTTATSFLRSFFPNVFSRTKLVSFDVRRGTEKIAVDILRGTGSNLNKKTRSSLKTIEPPLYAEGFNVNELDLYDTAFGTLDPSVMASVALEAADTLDECRMKIERSKEKQCADILNSGIITLESGDNLDFKRKAESLVDGGSGTYWTVATVDPDVIMQAAGDFLRQKGKMQGNVINVIMGVSAYNAFTNNPIRQNKLDIRRADFGMLNMPQRNSIGGSYHGQVSAGSYVFNIWTYNEGYENASGTFVKYVEDTDCIFLPEKPNFKFAHAIVPQLPGMAPMATTEGGEYYFNEYVDVKNRNHVQEILSAAVAIPTAVDQIYTAKVTES
jgi:hypothetical protein